MIFTSSNVQFQKYEVMASPRPIVTQRNANFVTFCLVSATGLYLTC